MQSWLQSNFQSKRWIIWSVLAAAWLILNLITLARYPVADCDEAYFAEISYHALYEGRFAADTQLNIAGSNISEVHTGRLFQIAMALPIAIFGVTLWASRFSSLAAGIITLLLLSDVGRSMFNERVGSVAAVIAAVSWRLVFHSHYARPDIWNAVASIAVLWLIWRMLQRPTFGWAAAAGLAASLVVDLHPNSLAFAVAAGVIAVVEGLRLHEWRMIGGFAAGGIIGLIYVVAAHLLPDPSLVQRQLFGFYGSWGMTDLGGRSIITLLGQFLFIWYQFGNYGTRLAILPLIYYVLGVLYILPQKSRPYRILFAYFAIAAICYAYIAWPMWYYSVMWEPLLILLAAIAVDAIAAWLTQQEVFSRFSQAALTAPLIAPLVIVSLGYTITQFSRLSSFDLRAYTDPLVAKIPNGATLAAPEQFWLARPTQPFVATGASIWLTIDSGQKFTYFDRSLAESYMDRVTPGYVILNREWLCMRENVKSVYYPYVAPLIEQQCTPIDSVENPWYGTSTLYSCPAP